MSDVYERGRIHRAAVETGLAAGLATVKRMSWGAVFAGLFIVFAIQLLFSLLGFGVGLRLVQPASGAPPDPGNNALAPGVWRVRPHLTPPPPASYAPPCLPRPPRPSHRP